MPNYLRQSVNSKAPTGCPCRVFLNNAVIVSNSVKLK